MVIRHFCRGYSHTVSLSRLYLCLGYSHTAPSVGAVGHISVLRSLLRCLIPTASLSALYSYSYGISLGATFLRHLCRGYIPTASLSGIYSYISAGLESYGPIRLWDTESLRCPLWAIFIEHLLREELRYISGLKGGYGV